MKRSKKKVIANITVGEPDVQPSAMTHVRGVLRGNDHAESSTRSTGIRTKDHEPIDPRMPKLTPA